MSFTLNLNFNRNQHDEDAHVSFLRLDANSTKPKNDDNLNLNLINCLSDIYKNMPKLFTITTNGGSYQFNIDFLKDSSQLISDFLSNNADNPQCHIDINDENNAMEKIQQAFQGESVKVFPSETDTISKIIKALQIKRFPDFTKMNRINLGFSIYNLSINKNDIHSFFKKRIPKSFTIITNSKEYECSPFGVLVSQIINDQIQKDPKLNHFEYNFSNEHNEFDDICKLFNFEDIKITSSNVNSLKKISEDLKISYLIEKVDQYIEACQKQSEILKEQQVFIDLYDKIFDLLFHIKEYSLEAVKKAIMESDWIHSEDKIHELAAFFLQVSSIDYSYQQDLINLLLLLDKEKNDSNDLSLLAPFIAKQLFLYYGQTNLNSSFLYLMSKNGFIEINDIVNKLLDYGLRISHLSSRCDIVSNNIIPWFFPEIIELKNCNNEFLTKSLTIGPLKFISSYLPDRIDEFKQMRDKGEPDDPLTLAIRKDDIDSFKKLYQNNSYQSIPFNIFESVNEQNLVNYAASYGSIKCLQLMLNAPVVNDIKLFEYVLSSGNIEAIKCIEELTKKQLFGTKKSLLNPSEMGITSSALSPICVVIKKHNNKLFDWIIDNKICGFDTNLKVICDMATVSARCGNAYTFVKSIGIGKDLNLSLKNYFVIFIQESFANGFYCLSKIIRSLFIDVNEISFDVNWSLRMHFNPLNNFLTSSVIFGNLSIFKLALELTSKEVHRIDSINQIMSIVIQNDYFQIFKFMIDDSNELQLDYDDMLMKAIQAKSTAIFQSLLNSLESPRFLDFSRINFSNKDVEVVDKIIDFINNKDPSYNFTLLFIQAIRSGADKVCQCFIDKKVSLDYYSIVKEAASFGSQTEKIVFLLIDNIHPEMKKDFLMLSLTSAISAHNKKLIKFILDNDCLPNKNQLFQAVKGQDIEIIDMILNCKSEPSFVNQVYEKKTVLRIATDLNDLQIVKRLLAVPGIDPSLRSGDGLTVLMKAVESGYFDIVNEIVNFYGDDIKNQKWQLKKILDQLQTSLNNNLNSSQNNNNNTGFQKNNNNNNNIGLHNNNNAGLHNNNNNDLNQYINDNIILTHLDDILQLLNKFYDENNADFDVIKDFYSPLMMNACVSRNKIIVKKLLKIKNMDVNLYSPKDGNTPLIFALNNENFEIAELLIRFPKTNVNQRNYKKQTALTIAASLKAEKIVNLIINNEKFDPEESNANVAFFNSSGKIARQLWSIKNLNVNSILVPYVYIRKNRNEKGLKSCLMSAIMNKDYNKVDLILTHPSFNPGKSQLKLCFVDLIKSFNAELFRKFIKLVDNEVNILLDNKSLLYYSAKYHNEEAMIDILSSDKFDSKKSDIFGAFVKTYQIKLINNLVNETKILRLMKILVDYDKQHEHLIDFSQLLPDGKSYFTSIPIKLLSNVEIIHFFIDQGVDMNAPDKFGQYPLEFGINSFSSKIVHIFLSSNKIDLTRRITNEGRTQTYLQIAIKSRSKEIMEDVLKAFPGNLNVEDDKGDTPLILAVRMRLTGFIKVLFDYDDLDYLHKNKNGDDALAVALNINNISSENDEKVLDKENYCKKILNSFQAANLMSNRPAILTFSFK